MELRSCYALHAVSMSSADGSPCSEQFLGSSVIISIGNSRSCSFGSNQHECSIIVSESGSFVPVCVMESFAAYHDVWSRLSLRKT